MLDESVFELEVEHVSSKEAALSYLADKLLEKGIVKDSYKEAILKREKAFPTGLQFEKYGIAIPHTDVEHVNKEQIAIMTLKNPVKFFQMGTNNVEVSVRVIFMLALKEAHSQLTILQQLVSLLQDHQLMNELTQLDSSSTAQKLKDILAKKEIF